MSEKPILFSAPMVRAILNGSKSQTRRVVKPQPEPIGGEAKHAHWAWRGGMFALRMYPSQSTLLRHCHYGAPGDRLWVRETFMDIGACFLYRADADAERERSLAAPGQKWQPSIHMPRDASRITLEVTGVRVERLQDISAADCISEGISFDVRYGGHHTEEGRHFHCTDPRESYASLWDSINGPGSWDANPWVWVVEFRPAEKPGA